MKCRLSFIAIIIMLSKFGLAQGIDPSINKDAPRIIPPPPNASALTKFSGVDVSLNTGMVNHNIPFYTVTAGKLSLPISFSYASNGVKVDEYPSYLGMTWTMEAGGVITRQINGARDETATRYEANDSWATNGQDMYDFILETGNPYWANAYDSDPDVFSFNFMGYSGKFVLDANMVPMIYPHNNLKIQTNFSGTNYTFLITDPNGVKYYFGGSAGTEESYSNNIAYGTSNQPHPIWIKSSFYLTKVEHPVYGLITFTYNDYYHEMDRSSISESEAHISSYSGCGTSPCPSESKKHVEHYILYNSKILAEINVEDWCSVVFNYSQYNFLNLSGSGNNGRLKILSGISVFNARDELVKSASFFYGYQIPSSSQTTKRPFLTSITIGLEQYQFEYYDESALPPITSYRQDHWGYFNNEPNSSDFISDPGTTIYYQEATANRNANPTYAVKGLLKKITHPTGGVNEILYEGNTLANSSLTGGMRVKQIKTFDGVSSTPLIRNIYYTSRQNVNPGGSTPSTGQAMSIVLDKVITNGLPCGTCTYDERSSSPVNNLAVYNGNTIAYEYVTESLGGTSFEQGGIEHRYVIAPHSYGTTVINGTIYDAALGHNAVLHGKEIETVTFKLSPSTPTYPFTFIKLTETANTYTANQSNYYGWKVNIRYDNGLGQTAGIDVVKMSYKSYWERLETTVTKQYDQTGANEIVTTKNYFYNNNAHLQVTKIETYDSQNTLLKSEFKYPADLAQTGNIYNDMVSRHIITPVVDQTTYSRTSLQEQVQLTFQYGYNSSIEPQYVKKAIHGNTLETFINYEEYDDDGNITQFTTVDGIKNSFIWGYENKLPIAEVKNADLADIAYTSFESDDKSGWMRTGHSFTDGTAPTGSKVYALNTGDVYKANLNPNGIYIVSYWSKSGAQNVNYRPATAGRTVNGWTHYEHRITFPPSATITVSGAGIIDELRLYPEGALMTTLTYRPLVGVSTQSDPNNKIVYYEYDDYNRLAVVRDQDKNVIKKICYNYAGQTENCTIYYNVQQSNSYTRNNCSGQGQSVNYVIPAGTYMSIISQTDANNKAWNDIVTNGQLYANYMAACGSGTCSPENCVGLNKKCINGVCEVGIKVRTRSREISTGVWQCVFHYEWSDGSWSEDYTEETTVDCTLID